MVNEMVYFSLFTVPEDPRALLSDVRTTAGQTGRDRTKPVWTGWEGEAADYCSRVLWVGYNKCMTPMLVLSGTLRCDNIINIIIIILMGLINL